MAQTKNQRKSLVLGSKKFFGGAQISVEILLADDHVFAVMMTVGIKYKYRKNRSKK